MKQRLWPWKIAILLLIAFDFVTPPSGMFHADTMAAAQTVYQMVASLTGSETVEVYTGTPEHVFATTNQIANTATAPSAMTSITFSALPTGTASTYACFTSAKQLISSATAC